MDAFLAIASKREIRRYADRPIPDDVVARILQAGRVSGSSRNRQPWTLHVMQSPDPRARAAAAVWNGENVRNAALVVVVTMKGKSQSGFDAGRLAQNMMLAASNDGVGSCPNGISDLQPLADPLGLEEGETVATVLTFGYPASPRDPESRSAEEWLEHANRRPLGEIVVRH
jgi:nitroreductase